MAWKRFGLVLGILPLVLASCGPRGTTVAKVGPQAIPLAELEKIYRPFAGVTPSSVLPSRADSLADRKRALEDLIQKHLLALEAKHRGLDKSPTAKTQLAFIAQELARNELYQEEIVRKTEVTEAGLRDYYNKQGEEVRCQHILVASKDSAQALLDSLKQGTRFDSLAARHSQDRGSAPTGGELGFFTYGMMVDPFWEAATKLKPGEVSGIVQTRFGYHLIRCEERRKRTQEPFEKVQGALRQEFARRMDFLRQEMTQKYIEDLKAQAKGKVDTSALALLARKAAKAPEDTSQARPQPRTMPTLTEQEKKTIVLRFAGGSWDLGRLLSEAEILQATRGIPAPLDNPAQMSLFIDQAFLLDLLYQKAKAKGLDRSAKVREALASATTDLLAGETYQALAEETAKGISEEELRAFFTANPDSFREVRLSRIIVPTAQEANAVLAELKKGKSFEALAKARSTDKMTAGAGGDLGYITRGLFPELDSLIFSLRPKAVSGVVPFGGAFCLLQVTEARTKPYEEVQVLLRSRLQAEKTRKALEDLTVQLKKTYPVTINESTLEKLGQGKQPRLSQ